LLILKCFYPLSAYGDTLMDTLFYFPSIFMISLNNLGQGTAASMWDYGRA
jgi:hypothetical protein